MKKIITFIFLANVLILLRVAHGPFFGSKENAKPVAQGEWRATAKVSDGLVSTDPANWNRGKALSPEEELRASLPESLRDEAAFSLINKFLAYEKVGDPEAAYPREEFPAELSDPNVPEEKKDKIREEYNTRAKDKSDAYEARQGWKVPVAKATLFKALKGNPGDEKFADFVSWREKNLLVPALMDYGSSEGAANDIADVMIRAGGEKNPLLLTNSLQFVFAEGLPLIERLYDAHYNSPKRNPLFDKLKELKKLNE